MSSIDPSVSARASVAAAPAVALALPVFAVSIFLSAFLLFGVQPMFTKMVLPVLGGTPGVWSVAMVFFQAVLLIGYGYAHILSKLLDPRRAIVVHLALMAAVFAAALPIGLAPGWGRPPADGEALWLIGLFAVSVGLPFFAIAGNGPLLQAWFAQTDHKDAKDPYFLYGASNLGSFLALVSYPFLIEPMFALKTQSAAWSGGFALLGLCMAAILLVMAGATRQKEAAPAPAAVAPAPANVWTERLVWIGLAAVPSGLLVAVTAHISTDVAAAPLLWVAPLALFLLTFVLAFREGAGRIHVWMLAVQPAALALMLTTKALSANVWLAASVFAHLGFFFVATMVCHGELYRRRPDPRRLTEFYVMLSVGGVIGGVFSSLLAPSLFNTILEYPLLVFAAVMCRPGVIAGLKQIGALRLSLIAAGLVVVVGAQAALGATLMTLSVASLTLSLAAIVGAVMIGRKRPAALALAVAAFIAVDQAPVMPQGMHYRERSFFAKHEVVDTPDGRGRLLVHGTTVHGVEPLRNADGSPITGRPEPTSYYARSGPLGEAIASARAAQGGRPLRIGVIGLGLGSLACNALPGEDWTFFEIDPVVVRIARDPNLFRSYSQCTPNAPVIVGDGRLTLADHGGRFDVIVLDAFSSDAVPAHLLTVEALAGYAARLTEHGVMAFHISNRNMELSAVVAASARENGFLTMGRVSAAPADDRTSFDLATKGAVIARRSADLGPIAVSGTWKPVPVPAGFRPWTDDYSNVMDAIRRHLFP